MTSAQKHGDATPDRAAEKRDRRFLQNTVALALGWNINALGRLIAAGWVVRTLGTATFGEYAVLVMWLTIAEWVVDFGTTEVFVREANQDPRQRDHMARIFLALKVIQAPAAVLLLCAGLIAMRYPQTVLMAGMAAGLSLFFTAGVAYCKAIFKSAMIMEREVMAEFVSVIALVASVPVVAHFGWGLMGLMGGYVLSRGVFLAGCLVLARSQVVFSVRGLNASDIRWGIHSAFAIGVIGFVVVVYNAADLLILSRTASISDVAAYSAAQRFTLPLTMALNAIAVSIYPVLAFMKSPELFQKTCQRAVDTTLLLGCYALVCLWCGAEFFLGLLGAQLVYGADALRILAVVCVVKALPLVIGPVLFLVRAQRYALGYMAVALLVKIAVMIAVTPRYGYMGAAAGSLGVEVCFLTPVTLYFVYRFAGFRIQLSRIWRLLAVVVVVIVATKMMLLQGTIAGVATAALLYPGLVLALRVVPPAEVWALLPGGNRL